MIFDILTIFPEMFRDVFSKTVLARALDSGIIDIRVRNIRDEAVDRHRQVDDYPFGGGSGMVLKPEPLARAIDRCLESGGDARSRAIVLLTPTGHLFNQQIAQELSLLDHIVVICGRYKGVDQRIVDIYRPLEISLGDFVISGGEFAAMVLVDAVARLVPGVLGDFQSAEGDSFQSGLLDGPHYTRPREFRGHSVPEVLLSGDHARIRKWRRKQELKLTLERRPDLLDKAKLSAQDRRLLEEIKEEMEDGSAGRDK